LPELLLEFNAGKGVRGQEPRARSQELERISCFLLDLGQPYPRMCAVERSELICPKTSSWDLHSLDALSTPWSECARLLLLENSYGQPPRWGTEVRVGWTNEALHGLFLCQDPEPWATKTQKDDALWEEEVVEIFLDPIGDLLSYFEFEINPLNTVADLVLRRTRTGIKKDLDWDCEGLVTACGRLPYGWVAAFRVPFESLGDCHPNRSPVWRVNFARIERPSGQPRELTAWSPTSVGTFHVPERFGVLRFEGG
jgi:hypothetical protein